MNEPEKPAANRGETRRDDGDDMREDGREVNRGDARELERNEPDESIEKGRVGEDGGREHSENEKNAEQGGGELRARRNRSGPVVWLALLIALISLGVASYPFWSHWLVPPTEEPAAPSLSAFETLADRVDLIRQDSRAGIEDLRESLDELSAELEADANGAANGAATSALAGRIEELSVRLDRFQGEHNTAVGGLRTRLGDLEGGLRTRLGDLESEVGRRLEQFDLKLSNVGSDLDRADHDLATRLLLIEVDSLLAIAQNQLALNAEGGAAVQAWGRAMERLTALDGAEFQDLKNMARREFQALQGYQAPDIASKVERLFEIAAAIDEWPVETVQPGARPVEAGADSGWRARLGQVVGRLVTVESVDREFLGPDEIAMAREQVRSTLQTAALGMVRARPELARNLIGEALEAARRVFDTDASIVSRGLDELENIAADVDRTEPPELADSRAEISRLLGGIR